MKKIALAVDQRLLLHRNPNLGWITLERLAEKSRRRYSYYLVGMPLHYKRRPQDGRVPTVNRLPRPMAQHRDRRRRRPVILWSEHATGKRPHAQRREIRARDILGPQGSGSRTNTFPPHTQTAAACLECCYFLKFRSRGLQSLKEGIGKKTPPVLGPSLDTALIPFSDAVKAPGIPDRQGPYHHGIDERKDCRGSADSSLKK